MKLRHSPVSQISVTNESREVEEKSREVNYNWARINKENTIARHTLHSALPILNREVYFITLRWRNNDSLPTIRSRHSRVSQTCVTNESWTPRIRKSRGQLHAPPAAPRHTTPVAPNCTFAHISNFKWQVMHTLAFPDVLFYNFIT